MLFACCFFNSKFWLFLSIPRCHFSSVSVGKNFVGNFYRMQKFTFSRSVEAQIALVQGNSEKLFKPIFFQEEHFSQWSNWSPCRRPGERRIRRRKCYNLQKCVGALMEVKKCPKTVQKEYEFRGIIFLCVFCKYVSEIKFTYFI